MADPNPELTTQVEIRESRRVFAEHPEWFEDFDRLSNQKEKEIQEVTSGLGRYPELAALKIKIILFQCFLWERVTEK